jgi:hypothetical protein
VRTLSRERFVGGALCATLLLLAVCAAAVVAHIGIDVIGDYALPHDTYDDVGHTSRLGLVVAAFGLLLAGAFGVLWAAFQEARTKASVRLRIVVRPRAFVAAVVIASLAAVAAMEALDAVLSGDAIADAGDLFGGSLLLGAGITVATALVAAYVAVRVGRFVEHARVALAKVFVSFIARARSATSLVPSHAGRRRAPIAHFSSVYLLGVPKRGPPLLRERTV